MHIFIDESGGFIPRKESSDAFKPDCVAAVILNDQALDKWTKKYGTLGKGSNLNEEEAQEILKFLDENRAKAFIVATNCEAYQESFIEEHRKDFVRSMDTATQGHPEQLRESVFKHMKYLENMNLQEYVKTMLITRLIENTCRGILLQTSTLTAKDLLSNILRCDNVDKKTESTIKYLICLTFNAYSQKKPVILGDSSKISYCISDDKKIFDFTKFLKDRDFKSDDECVGIKAADCIANFFRRILRKRLMLHDRSNFANILNCPYSIDFLHFNNSKSFIDIKLEGEFVISVLKDFGISSNENQHYIPKFYLKNFCLLLVFLTGVIFIIFLKKLV